MKPQEKEKNSMTLGRSIIFPLLLLFSIVGASLTEQELSATKRNSLREIRERAWKERAQEKISLLEGNGNGEDQELFKELLDDSLEEFMNDTVCEICRAGSYAPRLECFDCEEDGFCPEGFCVDCNPGTFSPKDGATTCLDCDPGYFQPEGGKSNCTICPAGSIATGSGSTSCSECDDGTVAPTDGSRICRLCSPGSTSFPPHIACSPCVSGSYCPDFGCMSCQKCVPGYYQNREGQESCAPCNYGTYSPDDGATECVPCGAGRYLDARGASDADDCKICPIGYYCPDQATENPISCPPSAYCPEGSSSPIYCSELFEPHPDPETLGCKASPVLYVIIAVGAIVLLGIVSLIIYNRRRSKYEEDLREEASKILEKNPGPVYQGL